MMEDDLHIIEREVFGVGYEPDLDLEPLFNQARARLENQDIFERMVLAAPEAILYLEEQLRFSYPMTPVDCLISELREICDDVREQFDERVAQFKKEVES